jgi:pimeloyl-ACP methyl ester carboxylesterase
MRRVFAGLALLLTLAVVALFVWGYAPDRDPAAMRAKYTNASSQFIDLGGGLRMHVRDEGKRDGPALVLLHGSNASLHTWEPWVARLGARYRIISFDQIGHGLTGPDPANQYDQKRFVDVVDQVTAKLAVDRFALAGNSMGGGIALSYALAHPEKVTALILVDAAGAPQAAPRSLPIGFRIAQMPGINRIAEIITPRGLIETSLRQSISNQAIIDNAMIDRYWELLLYPGNRRATGIRFATVRSPFEQAQLGSLKLPTLIIWGAEDSLIPLASGKWLARAIPGAKLVVYNGIGHIPMEEAPDRSAADVDAFLRGLSPESRK